MNRSAGPVSSTFTVSPTLKPLRRAVPTSMATSWLRTGRRPAAIRAGPTWSPPLQEIPNVGAPAVWIVVRPSLPTNCA